MATDRRPGSELFNLFVATQFPIAGFSTYALVCLLYGHATTGFFPAQVLSSVHDD
jgi:hypothetical protein